MAEPLKVTVQPKTTLGSAVPQSLFARLIYTREVPSENPDDAAPKTVNLQGSRRAELDVDGEVTFGVDDYTTGTKVIVRVELAQGLILWNSDDLTPSNATPAELTVQVPDEVYGQVSKQLILSGAVLSRTGRFVTLDDTQLDMTGSRLYAAPVRPAILPDGTNNPQQDVVRSVLGLAGTGEVTTFEAVQLDPSKIDAGSMNALGLQAARVNADGAFDVSIDIVGDEVAWLWLLLGTSNYAGFQLDPIPTQPRMNMVVVLPLLAKVVNGGAPAPTTGGVAVTSVSGASGSQPPLIFDEQQMVDHPDRFGDDPGSSCSPFENPHRILGERPFFTILRVDQPDIGSQGSLKVSRPIAVDLVPPIRLSTVSSVFERDTSPGLSRSSTMRARMAANVAPRLELRATLDREILKPSMHFWKDWLRVRSKGRELVSGSNPIEWEGDPSIYQAASVAGGHVLEWRVRWRSNGYSLGSVVHTLTLAPRQTRRISKISWRRSERASRREETGTEDALTQVTTRSRDYTDAVQSSLSEWAHGQSQSRTTGVAGGIGFAIGPVVVGGGAAHGRASSSSSQSGGRRVAASEHQQLRDAIRQYGEATRRLESTVVTEISQEEEVEGVAETLRNINYCHALTVVYYEILRHLRVDTEFAGLRECLFVPFSITPFDVDKVLKWREQLKQGMLDRSLRWALDYLDEVDSAWANSSIPAGPRMDQEINYLTGSIYLQLSIERPREIAPEEQLDSYYEVWSKLAPILGMPVRRIVEQLTIAERDRDAFYQREVAPTMAARWVDRLELYVDGAPLPGIDFTLASSYRFGNTVRIDFTAPASGITRRNLEDFTVLAKQSLPIGSVANVKSMTLHYYTDHYNRRIQSASTTADIISSADGQPDAGVNLHISITPWEAQDQRRYIEDAVERLITHLNANLVYYHKVIWWLMDRDELYMLLDGFTAPYGRRFEDGKWVEDTGRSIASIVERDPMAILGNTLVMRVAAGAFLGIDGHNSPDAAHRYYFDSQVRTEPLRVSLPTEGLYAQALMDKCEACEEHFGSTDWVLTNAEPELEALADQLGTRRQAPENLTPTEFPSSIISLQNAPAAPDPTGLAGILQAVTTSDAFRDMAGLAGTQANALGALTQAASLAQGFGQMAVDFQKSKQGTATAKQKLSNIKQAKADGLMDDDEAKRQTSRALDEQNMTPQERSLTQEGPVSSALTNAASTGRPIEASRRTKDSFESVKVGGAAEDSGRAFIIEADDLNADRRSFGPRRLDKSGQAALRVRVPRLPSGGSVRWSIPPGEAGHYTFDGPRIGMSAGITALRPGLSAVDVEVLDSGATVIESQRFPISVPQFVTVDIDVATFTPLMTGFGLASFETEEILRFAKETCDTVLNTANVRTIWRMAPFSETLPAQFAGGGPGAGLVTGATFHGDPPSHALYGRTSPGSGAVGPATFDEVIQVFPGAFDDGVAGNANEEVDEVTNEVIATVVTFGGMSSNEKSLALEVFGRVLGETLAHEIVHSLVGSTLGDGFHNAHPGFPSDLMNHGIDRSFAGRSGFNIVAPLGSGPLNTVLQDRGVFFVNIITADAQNQVNQSFPIPGSAFP